MRGSIVTNTHLCQHFLLFFTLIAVLPATPAFALDCKVAATKSEKAICADPAALAADASLGKVYETLRAAVSPEQRTELGKSQSRWIVARDFHCADKTGHGLSTCLADESKTRADFLKGNGKLVPFFQIEKGSTERTDIEVQVFKFPNPTTDAEKTFNAEVEKQISDIAQPDKGDTTSEYTFSALMSINSVSPRLISAQTVTSTFLGGAHPNTQSANINIDAATGKITSFTDMLDTKSAQGIFKSCAKQVLRQKKENQGKDADVSAAAIKTLDETVASVSTDLALWSFFEDKAVITYDSDVLGAHVEGVFDCTIPYAQLRPIVKTGFPLPQLAVK